MVETQRNTENKPRPSKRLSFTGALNKWRVLEACDFQPSIDRPAGAVAGAFAKANSLASLSAVKGETGPKGRRRGLRSSNAAAQATHASMC